eukprot:TRINITY_DN1157_c0_g2_i4.p1 TRINITY_DN1157_c0_g2~~TRINITY_DN1157_c0_g2_i4.p1  ORF type:complete len:547 (-),score=38.25 TRINITY_DN1157_c0_g2_i4:387-2027(-)
MCSHDCHSLTCARTHYHAPRSLYCTSAMTPVTCKTEHNQICHVANCRVTYGKHQHAPDCFIMVMKRHLLILLCCCSNENCRFVCSALETAHGLHYSMCSVRFVQPNALCQIPYTCILFGWPAGATAAGKRLRVDACASDFSKPSAAKGLVPGSSPPQRLIFFYAGREYAVDVATAMAVAQVSPECGLIKDAAHGRLAGRVPGHFVEAAEQLCAIMALIYDNEAARQAAFHQWFNKYLPGLNFIVPPKSSNSNRQSSNTSRQSTNTSASEPVNNDGHCVIASSETDGIYVILIVEVKNEEGSSGAGYFQVFRYYQDAFGNGDGTRNDDVVVRATGAPALGITIAGPHLAINGMYFKEPNVVVAEPLMNTATLIDLTLREEAQMMHLARVLAALSAAAWNLRRRYCMEKHLAVRNDAFGYTMEALQLFDQQAPERKYVQRFKEVVELHSHAEQRGSEAHLCPPVLWCHTPCSRHQDFRMQTDWTSRGNSSSRPTIASLEVQQQRQQRPTPFSSSSHQAHTPSRCWCVVCIHCHRGSDYHNLSFAIFKA